jgi:HEAT repeat protein
MIQSLGSEDVNVWWKARRDLRSVGSPAVEYLIPALLDPNPRTAEGAAWVLGIIGEKRAREPLAALLKHDRAAVRSQAALSLAWLRDSRAVPELLKCLRDKDIRVRQMAAEGLHFSLDQRAAAALLRALKDEDSVVRAEGCFALVKMRDPEILATLVDVLSRQNATLRRFLCRGMDPIEDHRLADALVLFLADEDEEVRHACAYKLAEIGSPYVLERVMPLLHHDSSDDRHPAAYVIGFFAEPSTAGKLAAVWNEGPREWVKIGIAVALARLSGDQRAVPFLLDMLRNENHVLVEESLFALERVGSAQSVDPIMSLLQSRETFYHRPAMKALRKITGLSMPLNRAEWLRWYETQWRVRQGRQVNESDRADGASGRNPAGASGSGKSK